MSATFQTRILATILFSDIQGYSKRMQEDERRTLDQLRIHNAVFKHGIERYRGRVVKTIGDAFMVHFPAPSEAARCAVAVQQALGLLEAQVPGFDVLVRIGIHLGEVFEDAGDLFGKAVNIAARVESLAPPGGVAVTEETVRHLHGKVPYQLRFAGLKAAKNVGEIAISTIAPREEPPEEVASLLADTGRRASTGDDEPAARNNEEPPGRNDASIEHALVRLGGQPLLSKREPYAARAGEALLQGRLPIVVIQGLPGIGKSCLLRATARDLAKSFRLGLTLRLDGPAALDLAFVLDEVNRFLAALGRQLDPAGLRESEPTRALARLVSQVPDEPVLILVDGVDEVPTENLVQILKTLSSGPQTRILAAMRERRLAPETAHWIPLPPLDPSEARQFITDIAEALEVETDPDQLFSQVPESVLSHPQGILALLTALRDVPSELLLADSVAVRNYAPVRLIEHVVASLPDLEKRALALTAALNGADLGKSLKALRLVPPSGLLSSIQSLLSKALLQRADSSYRVPGIVEEAIRSTDSRILAESGDHVAQALGEAVAGASDSTMDLATLASLAASISHRRTHRGDPDFVLSLASESFLELLNRHGFWKEYCVLLRLGFAAARDSGAPFANLGFRLVRKALQTGDTATAREVLADLEGRIEGTGDTPLQAELHSHRAMLLEQQRKPDSSLRELLESVRIRKSLGDKDGVAVMQKLLGNHYLRRRDYALAREAFNHTVEQFRDQPRSKERIEAEISLGLCDMADGDLEAAERRLRAAREECGRAGYPAGLPRACLNLASVVEKQGRSGEALELARQAADFAGRTDPAIANAAHLLIARLEESQA